MNSLLFLWFFSLQLTNQSTCFLQISQDQTKHFLAGAISNFQYNSTFLDELINWFQLFLYFDQLLRKFYLFSVQLEELYKLNNFVSFGKILHEFYTFQFSIVFLTSSNQLSDFFSQFLPLSACFNAHFIKGVNCL